MFGRLFDAFRMEDTEQVLFQEVRSRSPDTSVISDSEPKLENCYNLSGKTLYSVLSQEITPRRKEEQKQSDMKTAIATGILFLFAMTGTLANAPLRFQCGLYLLSFAILVLYDPFSLFCIVLSIESRRIITFLDVMTAIGVMFLSGSLRYWLAVSVLTAIGLCAVFLLNYRWMKNENYCMTESVEGAIVNSTESVAYQAYISQGKTKCRTLALRQNFQFDERILDGCFGLFYRLGFWDGWKKTEQVNVNMKKLTDRAEVSEKKVKEITEELNNIKKEYASLEKERNDLKGRIDGSVWTAEYHKKLYEDISAENIRLRQSNDELIGTLKDVYESHDQETDKILQIQTVDERIVELLRKEMTTREVAELVGKSKSYVGNLRHIAFPDEYVEIDGKWVSKKSQTA